MSTFWSGPRRARDKRYQEDCTFYIRKHIKCLQRFRHNLDLIVLAISHNAKEPKEFTRFLNEEVPEKIQNTPVVVFRRNNNYGMSYGGLHDVFMQYRTNYKYYFFVEDDYAFLQHDFDKICDGFFKSNVKCGYVCSEAKAFAGLPHHAAISNGCILSAAMESLYWRNRGRIYPFPHEKHNTNYNAVQKYGQLGFSRGLMKCNFEVKDFKDHYRSGFRVGSTMGINWVYSHNKKIILGPL